MKKIIALIASAAIMMSAANAFAYSDYAETEATEFLSALNVISGYEDGTFRPDNNITRSEIVRMLVCARGKDYGYSEQSVEAKEKLNATEPLPYPDVDINSWDWGYWFQANDIGFISGFEDGTARPNENVTYAQLLKMLVFLTGYETYAKVEGGYPNGYILWAETTGISKGITVVPDAKVTRKDAAQLIYNAMNVPVIIVDRFENNMPVLVVMDGTAGYTWETLLEAQWIFKAEGVVNSVSGDNVNFHITNSKNFDGKAYDEKTAETVQLNRNGFDLKKGGKYTLLIEKPDQDVEEYNIKYIFK